MPIRTVKRGSGITEEELEKFEFTGDPSDPISDREFAQFVSFMDQQRIQRARQKDWLAHVSHQILAVQGLPAYFGYYRGSERGWLRWEKSDDYELEVMRILGNPHVNLRQRLPFKVRPEPDYRALEDIAEEIFGSDSDEHFAARIVGLFYRLMIARREKVQSELEHIIFTLGECCAAWKLKHDAEDVWKIGQRVRSGGQEGAKIAHGTPEARDQLKAQIRHKVESYIAQGLKKTKAYERVAKELKMGVSTVRRSCSSPRG